MVFLGIGMQLASATPIFDSNAIVAIKVMGKKDFCSGVVVGTSEVLTATHCIYDLRAKTYHSPRTVRIGIGENIADDSTQWFEVIEIASKPSARITTAGDFLGNDIVRLTTAGKLAVTPVTIASDPAPNTMLIAWGFGEDQWGYYGIRKSRPLENPMLDDKLISFASGACRGDSGGPVLNARNQVVGIISVSEVQHCVEPGKRFAQRIGNSEIWNN